MTTSVSELELRDAVRRMFDRVAGAPQDRYRFEVGRELASGVGYPREVLQSFPDEAAETFTGLAFLHPHVALRPGERVLDLGCGAGLDSLIAGRAVSPGGSVTGVDVSASMVAKARAVAASLRADEVRFEQGQAEALPFAEKTFDAALVNGIFNLCPDKLTVARELHRVMKVEGRVVVAEITSNEPLLAKEVRTVDDWFR